MRAFLDALVESVYVVDQKNRIVFINKMFAKRMGYDHDVGEGLYRSIRVYKNKQGTYIEGCCLSGEILNGVVQLYPLIWEGESCICGIIKWNEKSLNMEQVNLLSNVLDSITEDVVVKDHEGRFVYMNESYALKMNVSREMGVGMSDRDFWSEEFCERFREQDDYVREYRKILIVEEKMEEMGEEQYYEVMKFPLIEKNGGQVYVGCVIRNISLSKTVQDQVLKSQMKFESLGNLMMMPGSEKNHMGLDGLKELLKKYFNNNVNIWLYDKESNQVKPCFNNPGTKWLLEEGKGFYIKDEEVEKYMYGNFPYIQEIKSLVPIEGAREKLENVKYCIICSISYEGEFLGILSLGYRDYPRHMLNKKYLLDGICKQIALIIKNEYLSRKLQKELEKRKRIEDEIRDYLDISTDLIVEVDWEGNYRKVNPGCVKILGWSAETLLSMKWSDIIHPEDYEKVRTLEKVGYRKEKYKSGVQRYRCVDGTYKWLRWEGYIDREKGCIRATAKDVTYEQELKEREEEAQRIIQLEKLKNEFFANLSHELRTPLTIIMSAVQMINKYGLNQELDMAGKSTKKYMRTIKQNSYRLLRLVNNLVDVTKIDAGYYEIKPRNCNIINVVEEVVLSVVQYAEEKSIELTFDTEEEEEIIACDPDKIERIMLNLLSNAIKYNHDNGKVCVDISIEEQWVVIEIKDSGIGIREDKLSCIFERFTQVHDVLEKRCEGSGIGLSLVKSLVELHEGVIGVESKVGEGSVFVVRLPRKQLEGEVVVDLSCLDNGHERLEKCHIEFSDVYSIL